MIFYCDGLFSRVVKFMFMDMIDPNTNINGVVTQVVEDLIIHCGVPQNNYFLGMRSQHSKNVFTLFRVSFQLGHQSIVNRYNNVINTKREILVAISDLLNNKHNIAHCNIYIQWTWRKSYFKTKCSGPNTNGFVIVSEILLSKTSRSSPLMP